MSPAKPSLSVIIPTYKRDTSVARIVAALAAQTLPDIEIVIVDQNPPGYLDPHLSSAPPGLVHLRLSEPNACTARNVGYVKARADHLLFIDDDLVPAPLFCEHAMDVFRRFPEIGCLCPFVETPAKGGMLRLYEKALIEHHPKRRNLWRLREVASYALFFERSTYLRAGGFDEVLFAYARASEDQELCFRLAARGIPLWLDRGLVILHDDTVPGGAELRTIDRWAFRERCMRSWALRARIHHDPPGELSASDEIRLYRSAFLNRALLQRPLADTMRAARMMRDAIEGSREALSRYEGGYPGVLTVNHVARHLR